jgi:sugar/nucleoside kinase (ribokinase family)
VAYLRGDSLADAQRLASDTAAYVCSRKGAMPE